MGLWQYDYMKDLEHKERLVGGDAVDQFRWSYGCQVCQPHGHFYLNIRFTLYLVAIAVFRFTHVLG